MAAKKKAPKKKTTKKKVVKKKVVKRKPAKKTVKKKTVKKKIVKKKTVKKKPVKRKTTTKRKAAPVAKRKKRKSPAKKRTTRRRSSGGGGKKLKPMDIVMMAGLGGAGAIAANMIAAKIPGVPPKAKAFLPIAMGGALLMSKFGRKKMAASLATGMVISGGLAVAKQFLPNVAMLAGEEDMYLDYIEQPDEEGAMLGEYENAIQLLEEEEDGTMMGASIDLMGESLDFGDTGEGDMMGAPVELMGAGSGWQ